MFVRDNFSKSLENEFCLLCKTRGTEDIANTTRLVSVSSTTAATQTTSTSIPNNGNCNSDTKATVDLALVASFLGLPIAGLTDFFMWKQLKYKRAKASDKITPPATSSNNALARMSNLQQNPRGDPQLTDPTVLQSLTPTTGSYLGPVMLQSAQVLKKRRETSCWTLRIGSHEPGVNPKINDQ